MSSTEYKDYGYSSANAGHMHGRLVPQVLRFAGNLSSGTRILDAGCGNGYVCSEFLRKGCHVVGIDLSASGIEIARKSYPQGRFGVLGANAQILENPGESPFDVIISTEMVEHLYDPRAYARGCFDALKAGGKFICSTPYHGYLKNLALSLAGKWDVHANPLWDGGHIKLWSRKTLTRLLEETGFRQIQFQGVGRAPGLWMTMVMCGAKKESPAA